MKKVPIILAFVLATVAGAVFGFSFSLPGGVDHTTFVAAIGGGCFGAAFSSMAGIRYIIDRMEERQP